MSTIINSDSVFQEVISRKVLVDEGLRQVVELEQAALWRFLWWSGTFSIHILVDQNRKDHSVRTPLSLIKWIIFVSHCTVKLKQLLTGVIKTWELAKL